MTTNGGVLVPFDVIDIILDILHNDNAKASLSACSQVCHQFLHPCRRHLFSDLIYYAKRYGGEFRPFSAFLQDSKDIRPYIRQLSLHGKFLDVSELLIILELLPSLQDLTLRRVCPYYKNSVLSKSLCYPRHLKSLTLGKFVEFREEFVPPLYGLDTGSIVSMFPDVDAIMLNNVNFYPSISLVPQRCVKKFRANVERSLHSLGLKMRINPRAISISGWVFYASAFPVVFQLGLPILNIVLDIEPQHKIHPRKILLTHQLSHFELTSTVTDLSIRHESLLDADFLRNISFTGYVYRRRGLTSVIWESFEQLVLVLSRKAVKEVTFHVHYPEFSLDLMTDTLRTFFEKDWGCIQKSLDEMKGLKILVFFFSYDWKSILLDQVDKLIELDERWEGVVKEKLTNLHQRGLIRFESSTKHHIHHFKK